MAKLLKYAAVAIVASSGGAHHAFADSECRIVALGDSLTAGYGLDFNQGFPARLQQALLEEGFSCEVLDAGVSGDTTAGGLARLDWVLADKPSHVILELGANDALRALPVEQMRTNLDAMIGRMKSAGISVLLAGMLAPPNLGTAYGEAFAAVYKDLAAQHDIPLYPFFLEGVVTERSLIQDDGLHPTAEGIDIVVDGIMPTVLAWLRDTSK